MQYATDPAIECQFAATDRVNCHTSRVRGILDGKFDIDLHRHIAEEPSFHSNKGDLVVELPGHVIARPNVDIFLRQALPDH